MKRAREVQVKVSFSLLKGARVTKRRVIPSVKIESNPYLCLNCSLELKFNLIVVCLCFQQTCFRVDGLGLLWVTCLLLCVNCGLLIRQEMFWVEKLPVVSSFM